MKDITQFESGRCVVRLFAKGIQRYVGSRNTLLGAQELHDEAVFWLDAKGLRKGDDYSCPKFLGNFAQHGVPVEPAPDTDIGKLIAAVLETPTKVNMASSVSVVKEAYKEYAANPTLVAFDKFSNVIRTVCPPVQ